MLNWNKKTDDQKDKVIVNTILTIMGILSIWMIILSVEASTRAKIDSSICTTDKCHARIERLKECQHADDIIRCATDKTVTIIDDKVYKEMEQLFILSTSEVSNKWKADTLSLLEQFEGFSPTAYCDNLIYNSR